MASPRHERELKKEGREEDCDTNGLSCQPFKQVPNKAFAIGRLVLSGWCSAREFLTCSDLHCCLEVVGLVLTGFHGTSIENSKSILESSFQMSGESSWLGKGVYFFEDLENAFDGKANAKWWCSVCKKLRSYAILKACIASDNIFDMINDEDDKRRFEKLFVLLYDKHVSAGNPPDSFSPSVVYNVIGKDVDAIRSMVDAKKYTNLARTYAIIRPQSQICVCNNISTVISDIKREEEFYDE